MMNDRKNVLLHLYGEQEAEGDLRNLLKDEEMKKEHLALSEARFKLDCITPQRPESSTIHAIMVEAQKVDGTKDVGRRGDRPPVWRSRSLRRVLIPALSIAAAVVFAIGLGVFENNTFENHAMDKAISRADVALTPAESLLKATPVPPSLTEQIASFDLDPELTWDDGRDVRQLYRRIESLRPADDLAWDERVIPLELLPSNTLAGQPIQRAAAPRR